MVFVRKRYVDQVGREFAAGPKVLLSSWRLTFELIFRCEANVARLFSRRMQLPALSTLLILVLHYPCECNDKKLRCKLPNDISWFGVVRLYLQGFGGII
eukprot:6457037-Amphidinium_carterae.1